AGILTDDDRRFALDAIEATARALTEELDAEHVVGRAAVLGFPVQDRADEVALQLLALLLEPDGPRMTIVSSRLLASEVVATVERDARAAVCFGAVTSGGFAQTRYLVKRVRGSFPDIGIVVGRWATLRQPPPEWRDRLLGAGANHVGGTLADVRAHLAQWAHASADAVRRLA